MKHCIGAKNIICGPPYHITWYIYVWLIFFLLHVLLPVINISEERLEASMAMIVYVFISTGVAYLVQAMFSLKYKTIRARIFKGLNSRQLKFIIIISLFLSSLGFGFLWYDRTIIQGIDYSQGITVARELWRVAGEERQGISSLASIFGYVFGSFFFVSAAMIHLHWENLSNYYKWFGIIISLALIAGNSYLLSGRSIVMMQATAVVSVGIIRRMQGKPFLPGLRVAKFLLCMVLLLTVFAYSIYIFNLRSEMSNVDSQTYASGLLYHLGGKGQNAFYSIDDLGAPLSDLMYYSIDSGAYITHSLWSFQTILNTSDRPGRVSFTLIRFLLNKLGLINPDTETWLLAGKFLSLPGTLWYDFGLFGFIMGAIIHGIFLSVAAVIIVRGKAGGLDVSLVVSVLLISLLSPLLLAIDVMSFPFMLVGYIGMHGLTRIFMGKCSWLIFQP